MGDAQCRFLKVSYLNVMVTSSMSPNPKIILKFLRISVEGKQGEKSSWSPPFAQVAPNRRNKLYSTFGPVIMKKDSVD